MPSHGLNPKFIDPKILERLQASVPDSNIQNANDISSVTGSGDLKQVKDIVRNNHWPIDHPIRQELWDCLCKYVSSDNHVDFYYEVEKDLFGEAYLPTSLPSFVDPAYCARYYLNTEGKKSVEKILHVILHIKPDITYCPILYPLISLFLHYMSEGMAFSCALKLLADRQNYISQTKSDHASSAYLVCRLTKKYAKNAYSQLEKELKEHEDLESMFQNWLSWIFKDLPFPYLVRIIDCFLIEKKKCLYRWVLALLILYSKNSDKTVDENLGIMQKLLDFFQNLTVPVEKIFKIAYGIRGFSEKIINQHLLKVQMILKSQSNLNERSHSLDHLSASDPVYHVEVNSAAQPVVKELRMEATSRTRSVGVVALGNFKSDIITAEQMSIIWAWLPLRMSMLQPEVIYSSNVHGVCLTAFYMTVGSFEPTVIVIKAMNDEIFGAYCSSSWNSRNTSDSQNKKFSYFGTGETFLFTLVPEARKYPWVGYNTDADVPHSAKLFMAADNHMINVGAGNCTVQDMPSLRGGSVAKCPAAVKSGSFSAKLIENEAPAVEQRNKSTG